MHETFAFLFQWYISDQHSHQCLKISLRINHSDICDIFRNKKVNCKISGIFDFSSTKFKTFPRNISITQKTIDMFLPSSFFNQEEFLGNIETKKHKQIGISSKVKTLNDFNFFTETLNIVESITTSRLCLVSRKLDE